jgi:hypothetical protein
VRLNQLLYLRMTREGLHSWRAWSSKHFISMVCNMLFTAELVFGFLLNSNYPLIGVLKQLFGRGRTHINYYKALTLAIF